MIPKSIKLAGFTINIILSDFLYARNKVVAEAVYGKHEIVIDTTMLTPDGMRQAYYHELIHWIFYILNEETLRDNEKLVDTMGHLLFQAQQCSEYHSIVGSPNETN